MNGRRRSRFTCAAGATVLLAALAFGPTTVAAQTPTEQYLGRTLADALRALQAKGLRIVFTSATVTPDLRVQTEPRAQTTRQLLDELLAPHGLKAQDGPGGVIQVVRRDPAATESRGRPSPDATGTIEGRVVHALSRAPLPGVIVQTDGMTRGVRTDATGRFSVPHVNPGTRTLHASTNGLKPVTRAVHVTRGTTVSVTLSLLPAVGTHSEHVTVLPSRPYRRDRGVASEMSLERSELAQWHGGLVDDPIRRVHAFPRVSVADDHRSEFTVRGSPFRHVEVVVDGVATPWLQHTAYGRGATGSLTMLTGQILQEATLRVGAYPHRFSDRLGAELDMTLREGSREQFELGGTVGGTSATIVGEGPIGRSGEHARGSWLVAARHSYLEWPAVRAKSTRTAFGFSDGFAKVVYDLRPRHQVGFSVLGGMSNVDGDDGTGSSELADNTNRTAVANLVWRSTLGSSVALTQRAYLVRHRFLNKQQSGQDADRGTNEEVVYRADIARPIFGGLLEAGAQVGRTASRNAAGGRAGHVPTTFLAGSSWQRSGYAHFAWTVTPVLTLSPGLRITDSTLLSRRAVTRWILGEYALGPRWTLKASAGASHQLPELHQVRGVSGSAELRPERATHLDVAIEQHVGKSVRWQATVFNRKEADILREPDLYPRLVGDVIVDPPDPGRYGNSLSGFSRGIELLVNRQSTTGLSGWAAYSYGETRYIDADRQETYWADFDQRHTLNVSGMYRFSSRTSVGAAFRAGSNFPIPAYLSTRDGSLVVANQRNQVRLPPYARLDLRADRGFESFGWRLTIFAEVANVLNRANVGAAHGSIQPSTGQAIGFTDTLLLRRASAGIHVEF